jgi:hypothetical protein
MQIEIVVAKLQGQICFLPAGDLALKLAEASDSAVLTPSYLGRAAQWSGADVVVVSGNCPAAGALLSQYLVPAAQAAHTAHGQWRGAAH